MEYKKLVIDSNEAVIAKYLHTLLISLNWEHKYGRPADHGLVLHVQHTYNMKDRKLLVIDFGTVDADTRYQVEFWDGETCVYRVPLLKILADPMLRYFIQVN